MSKASPRKSKIAKPLETVRWGVYLFRRKAERINTINGPADAGAALALAIEKLQIPLATASASP